jgi:hypothetical protein
MIYLPTIPSRKTITHTTLISQQTNTPYFTVLSPTQVSLIMGIPANYIVCGVKIQLLTQFVIPGSNTLTMSLGYILGSNYEPEFYATNFQLTGPATPTSLQITHADFVDGDNGSYVDTPYVAHDMLAFFSSNNSSYLSKTTQGEVMVTVLYRPY